jgi:2-polyprenyl-6-hydroxyphenyl methylase/3-demethylubiquinone-9 3-methyltransferase
MPADNTLYERPGDHWWDDQGAFAALRTALNPTRFGYFSHILTGRLGMSPAGLAALDVGCGGGLLAEEFARLGCAVTGIDPAEAALAVARAHAAASGLAITYQLGTGEALPFPDQTFAIVTCCDVLEHVVDFRRVILEIARVLTPCGVFFFDTINRTLMSNLLAINVIQEWRATRLVPPNLHSWSHFIRPEELDATLTQGGLARQEFIGLFPAVNHRALWSLWRYKRGAISAGELGRRIPFHVSENRSVSYAGYAIKKS